MEIFNPHSNIHFLRLRRFTIGIAIFLVAASLVLIYTKGLNYGLDFTGGVVVEVQYQQSVDIADVRQALDKGGFGHSVVQPLGGTREVLIRLQPKDDPKALDKNGKVNVDQVAQDVLSALKAAGEKVTIKQHSFVSSEVGASLRTKGIYAVIFVIIGIMAYLWIRFERRFAVAALLTEIHDAVVTVGIFALTQRQFDLTVLASVMAVVGYSINDKVVVFDRVRELFRLARKADPEEILNRSINSTLSRTIITSLLTGITMLCLFLMGGPVVHGFAITMMIGIVVGTLSSIFIASPILLWLGVSKKDLMPRTRDNPELARRP
ncbi:MAG TPA: protein translocase subunit SecF [Rhodanobacteraceae bacterium]|nr:protein translocase subunit SecF [Rhodanobacteraceae bacterium]